MKKKKKLTEININQFFLSVYNKYLYLSREINAND